MKNQKHSKYLILHERSSEVRQAGACLALAVTSAINVAKRNRATVICVVSHRNSPLAQLALVLNLTVQEESFDSVFFKLIQHQKNTQELRKQISKFYLDVFALFLELGQDDWFCRMLPLEPDYSLIDLGFKYTPVGGKIKMTMSTLYGLSSSGFPRKTCWV